MILKYLMAAMILVGIGQAEEVILEKPSQEKISSWIKDLTSDTYATRENAEKNLRLAGTKSLKLLKAEIKASKDPEVSLRAKRIVTAIDSSFAINLAIEKFGAKEWKTAKIGIEFLIEEAETNATVATLLKEKKLSGTQDEIRNLLLTGLTSTTPEANGALSEFAQLKAEVNALRARMRAAEGGSIPKPRKVSELKKADILAKSESAFKGIKVNRREGISQADYERLKKDVQSFRDELVRPRPLPPKKEKK